MTVARKALAFFAPVERETNTPTAFDPSANFDVAKPPGPWMAAGEVRGFKRAAGTKFGALTNGAKGAARGQFRSGLEARVAFDFCTWGKLQMAIAGGSQHMKVLAGDPVAVLSGSTSSEIVLGVGAVDTFNVGDMVAVDVDYAQQTGYVGEPAAAYVKDPAEVMRDRNYLRRVTFNVARVKEKTATLLLLDAALVGGAPKQGASAQKVSALVDREGGSFFQEWSGLFVVDGEDGGRVCFYYPRLQACAPAAEGVSKLADFDLYSLHAECLALPVKDSVDGETVVAFRYWKP